MKERRFVARFPPTVAHSFERKRVVASALALFVASVLPAIAFVSKAETEQAQNEAPSPQRSRFFEEDDPAVIWSGAWSTKLLGLHSAGQARLAMDAGAEASFTFVGTGASWIGYRDEWSGIAKVFVDGTLKATVDTYSPMAKARATLYTISGLPQGRHTLTVQATGTHSDASTASWIWVDVFSLPQPAAATAEANAEIIPRRLYPLPAGGAGRRRAASPNQRNADRASAEAQDPAVNWTGTWSTNQLPAHRDGSARLSMDAESRVSFVFTGTGVKWIGYRDEWSGIADVLIDGTVRATVDTYLTPAKARAVLFTVDGLPQGTHTLTVQPTGRHRPGSGGAWIWVDAFSVTP